MEFADKLIEPFGTTLLQMAVPTQLSHKTPLVFRIIKELVAQRCLPQEGDPRVELALEEALTNAMVHGNKLDAARKVKVHVFADEEHWGAVVEDEGDGFTPESLAHPDEAELLFEETGRGIMLMDSAVDELNYNSKGNAVMLKRRNHAEPDAVQAASQPAAPVQSGMVQGAQARQGAAVAVRMEENVAVIECLEDRLSDHNIARVRETVHGVLESTGEVVFDMRSVGYISSVVIGLFISTNKRCRMMGGGLVLAGVQPVVLQVLEAVKLETFLKMAGTTEEAIELLVRDRQA